MIAALERLSFVSLGEEQGMLCLQQEQKLR